MPLFLFQTPNQKNVSAYVALTGKTVNIKDAYKEEGYDFEGTINFDKKNENGILNFILLNGLGKAIVTQDVSSFEILESIKVLHEY